MSCKVFFFAIFLFLTMSEGLIILPPNVKIPAVIAFGDSVVDTGNNNDLVTPIKCDFKPYGKDLLGGVPTGRFSNGVILTDMLAGELGITNLIPSYLDVKSNNPNLTNGVCFASGGSGYDPVTSKLELVIPLSQQVTNFKDYIQRLKSTVGEARANYIITNALYIIVDGNNDIGNYYTFGQQNQYDINTYTDLLIGYASTFIKQIYALGARRIGVHSVIPIGCLPAERTLLGGPTRACAERVNKASMLFNTKLVAATSSLEKTLPGSKLFFVDLYNGILDLINRPQLYGFKVVDRGCCGTGLVEYVVLCNALSTVCPNASDHVFWDSVHLSRNGYRNLVNIVSQQYVTGLS